ncbi:MAG: hypothetical protein K1X57_09450 [Gemmataceae bacterium]|nr:hypothetical protein [Gemmataceae bacterium]
MTIPPDAIQKAKPWPEKRQELFPKLPPHQRYQGSLEGVPRVYFNAKFNAATQMPEDVIRSYLADPYMYNDWVWCTGMDDNARQADLVWVETGEPLNVYFDKLRAQARPAENRTLVYFAPITLAVIGAAVGWFKPMFGSTPAQEAGIIGCMGLATGMLIVVLARQFGWR